MQVLIVMVMQDQMCKTLEISLERSFKNLAIEPCKILTRIRQDLGSKYTRDLKGGRTLEVLTPPLTPTLN